VPVTCSFRIAVHRLSAVELDREAVDGQAEKFRRRPKPEGVNVHVPRVAAVQYGSLAFDPPLLNYSISKERADLSTGGVPESFEIGIKLAGYAAEITCIGGPRLA
jgi:hypothetical protein